MNVGAWLRGQWHVYAHNAGATKDFRVQLRGSRAILLWGLFLIVFTIFAFFTYSTINAGYRGWGGETETVSISQAQSQLHSFYQGVTGLLAGLVCLIAPAMGAGSIVAERQRRFLDLLIASPMSPKYYLVGKLISTYRSLWMLIILSMPLIAVGALMGGVSYGDVFRTMLLISLDGLIFAAIAIAISAGSVRLPSAILVSYATTILIVVGTSSLAAGSAFGMRPGVRPEVPFMAYLSPFSIIAGLDGVTTIRGVEFPAWLLFSVFAVFLVFVALLGAGSAMSGKQVRETTVFRSMALLLVGLFSYSWYDLIRGSGSSASMLGFFAIPIALAVPLITCFGPDSSVKFTYDGSPNLKSAFKAEPRGSAAYVFLLVLACFFGALTGVRTSSGIFMATSPLAAYGAYALGLNLFVWAVSRVTSQFAPTLAAARGLALIGVTLLFTGGQIVASILNGPGEPGTEGTAKWISPLSPLGESKLEVAVGWAVAFGVTALLLSLIKNPKLKEEMQEREQWAA